MSQLTKSQVKLLELISDEFGKRSEHEASPEPLLLPPPPPAIESVSDPCLDPFTVRFAHDCRRFEQFETKLGQSLRLFDTFLDTYNRIFAELHDFIAKTKPILYEQKRLDETRHRLNEHLQCFRRIEKFDPAIINSIQNVLRLFDECERNATYLFANRDFCDFDAYANRVELALRNVFVIVLDWFRDAFDSMDATVSELCTFDSEAVQPGDLLKSFIGHMVKYGTIVARFRPVFAEMRTMQSNAKHYAAIYREWLTKYADFFVMKRNDLFERMLPDRIETLVDSFNQDKCYLFQQLFCHLNKLIAQEIELFEHMFVAANARDSNQEACLNTIIETIKLIFVDYFRAVIGRVYHYRVLIELNDITRSLHLPSSNRKYLHEFVQRCGHDIRERFLHRIYIYFEREIIGFKATANDLNYPVKLYTIYCASGFGSKEDRYRFYEGFCYPTLKKTVQVICAINNVLGDKSSQPIVLDILNDFFDSLRQLAGAIDGQQSHRIDSQLFELMHLLILREQFKYLDFADFEHERDTSGTELVVSSDAQTNDDVLDCRIQSLTRTLIETCLDYIRPAASLPLPQLKFRVDKTISRLKLYLFDDSCLVQSVWIAIRKQLPTEACNNHDANYPLTVTAIDPDFSLEPNFD